MDGRWISARDALLIMKNLKRGDEGEAKLALLTLLKSGALKAIAARYDGNPPELNFLDDIKRSEDGSYVYLRTTERPLSQDFWGLVAWRGNSATADWDLGLFGYSYHPRGADHRQYENATGVAFESDGLRVICGERLWQECETSLGSGNIAPPASVPSNRGGRPPAAFADDLMCAIWARIFRGDFNPARQAEVESAVKDWAMANGHDLGDTSARDKARKIWKAMHDEVENPRG